MLNSIIQKDYKYSLFNDLDFEYQKISFPSTRYQGSKYKLVDWINYNTKTLKFETVLDAFGGTGCVSYSFKKQGKQVFYNDILKFNSYIATALIKNSTEILEEKDINFILTKHFSIKYPTFIQDNFKDIYFTQDENKWLDVVITNIFKISNEYKKSILVVSYRENGIPTIDELINILKMYKNKIEVKTIDYKYALSNNNTKEVLIIAL